MKRGPSILAWSACCLSLVAFAPVTHARSFDVTANRCGTVVLTPLPSDSVNEQVYRFVETGTTKTTGSASKNPMIAALASLTYECRGVLFKTTHNTAPGAEVQSRLAAASCSFTDGTPDQIRAQAISTSQGSVPPMPPVVLEVLHGTGKFSGIKGTGRGAGSLPISERSGAPQQCATLKWKFNVPDQPHRE